MATAALTVLASPAFAVDVATESELRAAIFAANGGGDTTINLTASIALTQSLPMLSSNITVNGGGMTIDANNSGRVFFVESGSVAVNDVIIANARAAGGNGGSGNAGGGGGLGAGAALFVNQGATLTVSNVNIGDASAVGGNGGTVTHTVGAGGGGGGLGGNGGNTTQIAGGGAGGGGYAGNGGNATSFGGTGGGGEFGNGAGAAGVEGSEGGAQEPGGVGAAGGISAVLQNSAPGAAGAMGGGGGGGGSSITEGGNGGAGGIGGGGGGGSGGNAQGTGLGGAGGDFGGGGGSGINGGQGAAGGFGGGGAGAGGAGGFGAGNGGTKTGNPTFIGNGGDGGSAYGGAIFVRDGGTLIFADGGISGTHGVTAGLGGSAGSFGGANGAAGSAAGSLMFVHGGSTTTFDIGAGNTVTTAATDDIAGTGGLAKTGAGTLVLGGTNTYSGGTVISGGTVEISTNANLGAAAGTLSFDGGTLRNTATTSSNRATTINAGGATFDTAADHSASGVIGGTGGLTKSGSGKLTLSGANTYAGGTVISGGTVEISADANLGAAAGTLSFDGSTLRNTAVVTSNRATTIDAGGATFDTAADHDASGALSGTGGLTKIGSGTLTLHSANTYTGATIIDAGTLALTGAGSLESSTITIGSVGTLETDGGGLVTAAVIEVTAGGTLKITGDETIGSFFGAGNLDLGATLTSGGDDSDITYSGVASGTGGLVKTGTGVWTLSGASSYIGATTVSGGSLIVDGSIASSSLLTIDAGVILGGIGTVGATVVNGTLAPGNSIGTLNVDGNLGFGAGATYAVEVSPANADRVNVTGTAYLSGATVAASYAPGQYVQRQYTIVNATGGVSGTFDALTGTAPTGFTQSLSYDGNNAYLVLTLIFNGPRPYSNLDQNQLAVAQAITAGFLANGGIDSRFAALDANGLTQVSGMTSTAAAGAGMHAAGQFLDAMGGADAGGSASVGDTSNAYAPLAYSAEPANLSSPGALAALGAEVPASSEAANAALAMSSAHAADPVTRAFAKRWAMWGTVYGSVGRIGGDRVVGSADLTARNWGIASGFERSFGNSRIGLSLGGAGSTFSLAGGLGNGSAGIFNAGIYGSHSFGNAYVSGALGYGWNNVRTTRNVPGDTLTANFNAHTLAGRLETGYRFGSTSAITPYMALQGGNYFLPAYSETSALNGPFALAYGRQSEAFLRSELGARFEHSMPTSTGSLKFSARAAWAYNAINDRAVTAAFAALPGQTFTVNGARPARSAALLDLGMEANFDSGLSAKINFNGEFSRNVSAYGASAKLIYRW